MCSYCNEIRLSGFYFISQETLFHYNFLGNNWDIIDLWFKFICDSFGTMIGIYEQNMRHCWELLWNYKGDMSKSLHLLST